MKILKDALILMAGVVVGATVNAWVFSSSLAHRARNPYEGTLVYENEELRVYKINRDKTDGIGLATIVYKDH